MGNGSEGRRHVVKVTRLEVENVKRIVAVDIKPEGELVVVGGQNGAGKTSVLDSIAYAIGGKKLVPAKPLREGAKKGSVKVTLDSGLIVVRNFRKNAASGAIESEIVVTNADGSPASSPQALLNSLFGSLSFDPLAFSRMSPGDQRDVLRDVVGVDTSEIEAEIEKVFDERRELGRDLRRAEAQYKDLPQYPDAPEEEVVVSKLIEKRDRIQRENAWLSDREEKVGVLSAEISDDEQEIARLQNEIDRRRREIAEIGEEMKGKRLQSTDELDASIKGAERTNSQVRANATYNAAETRFRELTDLHDAKEELLESLRDQKVELLTKAELPIEGIELGDAGVLFNGLPFEQASAAEQLRISVAMGFAMNPELKVLLIRDGSLLDDANLELVAEMAKEEDAQVWIERIGEGKEVSVIIEDGSVKEAEDGTE
jgi:hypothetical protein